MNRWRNIPCPFCGEILKDFRRVVTQGGGKGLRLHLDCYNKIKELKKRQGKEYHDMIYKNINYIQCIRLGRHSSPIFVYQ